MILVPYVNRGRSRDRGRNSFPEMKRFTNGICKCTHTHAQTESPTQYGITNAVSIENHNETRGNQRSAQSFSWYHKTGHSPQSPFRSSKAADRVVTSSRA
jgi:hypothetical protein